MRAVVSTSWWRTQNRTFCHILYMPIKIHTKLLHRIEDLALYHCGAAECAGSGRASDFESEHNIKTFLHKDFRFVRSIAYKTFPNGRRTEEKIGGFRGRISFEGNLTSVFPLIVLGEALHLGNDTTQGLGRFHILSINSTIP